MGHDQLERWQGTSSSSGVYRKYVLCDFVKRAGQGGQPALLASKRARWV